MSYLKKQGQDKPLKSYVQLSKNPKLTQDKLDVKPKVPPHIKQINMHDFCDRERSKYARPGQKNK